MDTKSSQSIFGLGLEHYFALSITSKVPVSVSIESGIKELSATFVRHCLFDKNRECQTSISAHWRNYFLNLTYGGVVIRY